VRCENDEQENGDFSECFLREAIQAMTPEKIAELLIQCSEAFDAAMRRLNPLVLSDLREGLLEHLPPLSAARQFLNEAGPNASFDESVRSGLLRACDFIIGAIRGFAREDDLQAAYISALRAARKHCRTLEALFVLCDVFPCVNRYFLEEGVNAASLAEGRSPHAETGIIHVGFNRDLHARGGYSLYIPEAYTPERSWPLIVALHGGYSHGRDFLWTWLNCARSRGFILFAPTSMGMSWSITNVEVDGQSLSRNLEEVCVRLHVDRSRILLTGMSDGGTYALELGLSGGSIYQGVAPVACALPPVDLKQAPGKRIFWIHGAQDWIFPLTYAIEAGKKLKAAGAAIEFKVVRDLSHAYPREENSAILNWFEAG
jgi:phospholipase/carboxylesterase